MLAVLTSDLVGSTRLTQTQFNNTTQAIKKRLELYAEKHDCIFDLYRGDEFQVVFPNAKHASHVLLEMKLFLNSQLEQPLNCTQSMALGDGIIANDGPGVSTGEAFIMSGRNMEIVRHGEFLVQCSHQPTNVALALMCGQLSYVLNRLNQNQSALLYDYVVQRFPSHQNIATSYKTSRQNISERLKAAGGDLLSPFINYINSITIEPEQ